MARTPPPFAPDDLLSISAAARMVDRGASTIRGWIAAGELKAWPGAGHPSNRPTLVSREDLRVLVAGKAGAPPRPPPAVAVDAAELVHARAERDAARAERDLARVELLGVHDLTDALRLVIRGKDERLADLATALEAERARVDGLTAELEVVKAGAGLPWWRRLLTTSKTPET